MMIFFVTKVTRKKKNIIKNRAGKMKIILIFYVP